MAKKVIIDCDVGVDDALALILAFRSSQLDVQAITAVNGNVPLPQVFENIQKVLSLIRPEIRPLIAKGADRPLRGKSVYAHSVHGESGLGGATIEFESGEKWWEVSSEPAHETISRLASEHSAGLTLVAIGPLTNVALALQTDPQAMRKLKEIVIMGGAVRTRGNITAFAEFNIFSDPLAAKIIFESGLPITLVPLDVTHQVTLTPQWIEENVEPISNPFSKFFMEATGYDRVARRFRKRERIYLHDPLALGVVIDSELVKKEKVAIHVESEEAERYGQTVETNEGPRIDVCFGVDAERFLEMFVSALR